MQSSNLSDAIWNRFQARKRQRSKIIGASCATLVAAVAVAVTVWPRPAMAVSLEQVRKTLSTFNSVQWTQYETGTIRDMGSDDPATVPLFEQSVDYYVSRNPMEIQKRFSPTKPWMGTVRSRIVAPVSIQGQKPEMRPTWKFEYREGPSVNLDEREIRWAVAQVESYLSALSGEPSKPEAAEYRGQKAIRIRQVSPHKTYAFTLEVLADPNTARLLHYQLEARRPSGERIFLRELSNFRYDEPAPMKLPGK